MLAIAIIFLIRIALYNGLTVKRYEIESEYCEKTHIFAVITDLHATYYGENQIELLEAVRLENPEAVLFVGDIAHDKRDFLGAEILLEQLAIKFPSYYVAGNHERWVDFSEDIKMNIENCGVTVISDSFVALEDNIRIFGVDDPVFYDSGEFQSALEKFDTDGEFFDILLSHRPEYAEKYAQAGYELTLCGHAHGGQVRIPFLLNGLFAPNQGYFPKYAGGIYEFDCGDMIVSRGLMIDELPRVFNPPELVIVKIVPTSK